jgi:hypothetical protein
MANKTKTEYFLIAFNCKASWIKEKRIVVKSKTEPTIEQINTIVKTETYDSIDFNIESVLNITKQDIKKIFKNKDFLYKEII